MDRDCVGLRSQTMGGHHYRRTGLVCVILVIALLTGATSVATAQAGGTTITIDGTTSPIVEGEQLVVTATVENTGEEATTQEIVLAVGGTERDATEIVLDAGESRTVELTWATSDGDQGGYTATVSSEDDSDSVDVFVNDDASFAVSVESTNSPVPAGETLRVTATVENTGDTTGTQSVGLTVDGVERDTTELTLDAGESRSVELAWQTASDDAGEYTATVASEDSTDETGVSVQPPATFTVSLAGTNAPIVAGEELAVGARVSNTGDSRGTQDIELQVDGTKRDAITVPLDPGSSAEVFLAWNSAVDDDGTHRITVASADEDASENVTVEPDATVRLDDQRVADVDPQSLVVHSVRLPRSGFVAVYDAPVTNGIDTDSLVGVTSLLDGGLEHTNVRLTIGESVAADRELYAVIHEDADGDNRFDAGDDGAITRDGAPVVDSATVQVATSTPVPTTTGPTPTPTPSPSQQSVEPTTQPPATSDIPETDGGEGPGFGPTVALVALGLGGRLIVSRRA